MTVLLLLLMLVAVAGGAAPVLALLAREVLVRGPAHRPLAAAEEPALLPPGGDPGAAPAGKELAKGSDSAGHEEAGDLREMAVDRSDTLARVVAWEVTLSGWMLAPLFLASALVVPLAAVTIAAEKGLVEALMMLLVGGILAVLAAAPLVLVGYLGERGLLLARRRRLLE